MTDDELLVAGKHVLVLGQGTGILALLSRSVGARQVTCVERSSMLYRMAKQSLAANTPRSQEESGIKLCDCPLERCTVQGELSVQLYVSLQVLVYATIC